jgi:hypothetical protein
MKTLILTFTLLIYSVSISAQDYDVVSNSSSRTEHKVSNYAQITNFTSDVILNDEFKYRAFLRKSKSSKLNFHLDGQSFTKTELTKSLRIAAVKSENQREFQQFLKSNYPQLTSVLSDKEMNLLYERFQRGTLKSYFQDLAENW